MRVRAGDAPHCPTIFNLKQLGNDVEILYPLPRLLSTPKLDSWRMNESEKAHMSKLIQRAATAADLPAAIDLFMAAVARMYERLHIEQPLPPRPAVETMWAHILNTGIFYVAETDEQIVALCHAVVRDRLWFLSGFWTRAELMGGGVGGPLLRQVWQAGARAGADTFFVWSSPDQTALASYLKLGMLPGYQLFTFAGQATQLPDVARAYTVEPATLALVCDLNAGVRATRREVDHRFWFAQTQMSARQVRHRDRPIGYFYVNGDAVGPACWAAPEHADALLTLACRAAMETAGTIKLRVPGINHDAIRFAFAHGLRFNGGYAHLFTSAPFGRLAQYLPSGPSLF